ncbi:MAG TPA: hypothetical protein VGA37_06660 [Gemmatimonadales bacterium]
MRPDVCVAVSALGFAITASSLAAQQTPLRFGPTAGTVVHTLTEVRTVTTLFGFPALPDGAAFEHDRRVSATQRVVAAEEGGWTVAVEIDSVRARRRAPEGAWLAVVDTGSVGQPVRLVMTPRFAMAAVHTAIAADHDVLRVMGAWVAGRGFAFPEGPVAAGGTFETGSAFRFVAALIPEQGMTLRVPLSGPVLMQVDSVVANESDEVTYLSFTGSFAPETVATGGEAGNAQSSLAGGYAGRLIWSRGWNAFVSGVVRVRVEGQVTAESAAGAFSGHVQWEATITHQVRF